MKKIKNLLKISLTLAIMLFASSQIFAMQADKQEIAALKHSLIIIKKELNELTNKPMLSTEDKSTINDYEKTINSLNDEIEIKSKKLSALKQ